MAVAYFKKSGALMCVSHGTNTVQEMAHDGELAYAAIVEDDVDFRQFYYDVADKKVKAKDKLNVRVFKGVIDNIPQGTKASVHGKEYIVEDGRLEISGNYDGARVTVLLTNVKYHSQVVEVVV